MRLSENKVDYLCRKIYAVLRESKYCVALRAEGPAVEVMKKTILDDLAAEEELDREVERVLDAHSEEIRAKGVDFHVMFKKTKALMARERKMVI